MDKILEQARIFLLNHARLLERRLFQVHFEGLEPFYVGQVVRAYQNPDGGLGHALEPDIRCPESQPIFVSEGLAALEEAGCRDSELAISFCNYLATISDSRGLLPFFSKSAYQSPIAAHWMNSSFASGLNPTANICGFLHFQGIRHDWLSLATETCCNELLNNPPPEAHTLACASRLAEYIPDRAMAASLLDMIAAVLPRASFYIPDAPVKTYGLTPLHFAPRPDSICRRLFTQNQIDGHIEELKSRQLPDGGWPIYWEAPGPASELEWRGRWTLDAVCRLIAYGAI